MEKLNDIRRLQLFELEILNEFVKICDDNNLIYFLSYGTLLGAVRHKGFIPWDDDIDVSMPREDYNKFCHEYYKFLDKKFSFVSYDTDPQYMSYVPRIINNSVFIVDTHGQKFNAWIDIFPIDGMPRPKTFSSFIHQKKLLIALFKLNLARIGIGINYCNDAREKWEKVLLSLISKSGVGKLFSVQKQIRRIDVLLNKYKFDEMSYCVDFPGEKFKDYCLKSIYGCGELINFEGAMYRAPIETEVLLTILYNNYMELPPENKRNLHSFNSIIVSQKEGNDE